MARARLRIVSEEDFEGWLLGLGGGVCRLQALTGVPVRCVDIRSECSRIHGEGRLAVVTAGLSEGLCPALRLGADVLVRSVGDERLAVWAAPGSPRPEVVEARSLGRDASASEEDILVEAGDWWRRASDAAQVAATFLACHPLVEEVRYPGLRGDPSFEVAARTVECGFGPIVDYRLETGGWRRFLASTGDSLEQVGLLEREVTRVP